MGAALRSRPIIPARPKLDRPRSRLIAFPITVLALLVLPVAAGLLGAALPAFGYLPVLGLEDFSLKPFVALLGAPGIGVSLALSLCAGLCTTTLAFLVVTGFVAAWHGTRVFRALRRLIAPLLAAPHAAAAFGLAFLIAPSGLLMRALSPWASGFDRPPDWLIVHDPAGLTMTAGLVVKEIPFLFLMALAALPQVEAEPRLKMARALGYGRVAAFLFAVLPPLYAQLRLPIFAIIAYACSVVDVALILGPTTPAPLAVRILEWQADPDLSLRSLAAAGALAQFVIAFLAISLWLALEWLVARIGAKLTTSGRRFRRDGFLRQLTGVTMSLSAGLVFAGLATLALWSIAGFWAFPDVWPNALTLDTWRHLGASLSRPLDNALLIAALSSFLAVVLALGALEYEARTGGTVTTRALVTLYLPLLVPQIAFLFGLDMLLVALRFDGRLLAVILAHLVFVFPYVLLSLSQPWQALDPRYALIARSLGRGADAIFWKIRLPMLARAIATATALGFAVSISLYLPTLLIGAGRWPTVTTEAVALSSGGDRRITAATALVQACLPFFAFTLAALLPALLFRRRAAMRAGG
ncbi:putative thiamine transport system permease protein [Rhodopseudomonas julia]|uniref:Thiamine transport system permease protein n=1 Tax=Rhodopseudomonas julia TaxID=200617 RepID=A0ABU0C4A3_9BRAD|nr:ABC transporter permease subunit [Rhodopseudomonas julia]MDQ0325052.1 putative thiamine transport system permease protein [Rhodopseudomonas julia]